jgi:hypothetical protein
MLVAILYGLELAMLSRRRHVISKLGKASQRSNQA